MFVVRVKVRICGLVRSAIFVLCRVVYVIGRNWLVTLVRMSSALVVP